MRRVFCALFVFAFALFFCVAGIFCYGFGSAIGFVQDSQSLQANAKLYIVTFDTGEGQHMPSCIVGVDEAVSSIEVPVRVGFDFLGYWHVGQNVDTQFFDSSGQPLIQSWPDSTNIVLSAKWEQVQTHEHDEIVLALDSSGGVQSKSHIVYHNGQTLPTIEKPTKPGYIFEGYHDNAILGKKYYDSNGTPVSIWEKAQDGTLYAQWRVEEKDKFNISIIIAAASLFAVGLTAKGILTALTSKRKNNTEK